MRSPLRLTLTNSQAALHDAFVRDLSQWLARRLDLKIEFVADTAWDEREARLDAGEIDLGWICGAPYVEKIARGVPLKILAAPVMVRPRYQNRPVYFSDVVVRADSKYKTFDDLRGARWAYNEPHSHSGYHAVRYFLSTRNLDQDFFREVIASGAHQNSIQMILDASADASAIDSTVLELLLAQDKSLARRVRVVESIGPSPMPPFVSGAHVSAEIRAQIQNALMEMAQDARGQEILRGAHMARLACVGDADYDTIRAMLRAAEGISL